MATITQNQIISILRDGKYVINDISKNRRVEIEYQQLDRMKNYCWKFKKTEKYWSDANWKEVAKDVQQAVNKYYSR